MLRERTEKTKTKSGVAVIDTSNHAIPIRYISAMDTMTEASRRYCLSRGVPIAFVIDNLNRRTATSKLMHELLVFIPFVVMFILFTMLDRDVSELHKSVNALRTDLEQNIFPEASSVISTLQERLVHDISNAALNIDYYRTFSQVYNENQYKKWFRERLIPSVWDCSSSLKGSTRSYWSRYGKSIPVGAIRIRVQRMTNTSCDSQTTEPAQQVLRKTLSHRSPVPCWGAHKKSKEAVDGTGWCSSNLERRRNPSKPSQPLFKFYDCQDVAGTYTTGEIGVYHCGGFITEIPFNTSCSGVQEVARMLFDEPECDLFNTVAARFITVEFFLYTPHIDTYQAVKMFFEITATGAWIPSYQIRSFLVWTETKMPQTVMAALFYVFVLYHLSNLIRDWLESYRETGKAYSFLLEIWSLLQTMNTITFAVVTSVFWVWVADCRRSEIAFPFPNSYPKDLDRILSLYLVQVYGNAFNTVLTFLQFLRFLRLNDRLSILSRSVAACQRNVIGVIVIFVFVITSFALTGVTLYGVKLRGFRNINTAFATLMRMLLGQIDYRAMRTEQRQMTGFFFWSFEVLGLFLLLNFIIAVLTDGFAHASQSVALAPIYEVVWRQWYVLRVSLHPANLRSLILLHVRSKSRPYLWQRLVECFRQHTTLIEDDEAHRAGMFFEDFYAWVPDDVVHHLGVYYAMMLWEDIEYDFLLSAGTDVGQRHLEVQSTILEGVKKALDPSDVKSRARATGVKTSIHVSPFCDDAVFGLLGDVEGHVARIVSKIRTRNAMEMEMEEDEDNNERRDSTIVVNNNKPKQQQQQASVFQTMTSDLRRQLEEEEQYENTEKAIHEGRWDYDNNNNNNNNREEFIPSDFSEATTTFSAPIQNYNNNNNHNSNHSNSNNEDDDDDDDGGGGMSAD
eukprot:PhM_4_TR10454/c3_g1_i1/m.21275